MTTETDIRCPSCNKLAGKISEDGIFSAILNNHTKGEKTKTAYIIRKGTVECCGSEIYNVDATAIMEWN